MSLLKTSKIDKLVSGLIEILFFTNLWIINYIFLLNLFNKKFAPAFKYNNDLFINKYLFPEPFEVPLYIFVSILIIIFIYLFYLYKKKIVLEFERLVNHKYLFFIKYLSFCLLLILFLFNLGEYPIFEKTIFPNILFFVYIFVLIAIIFIICFLEKRILKGKFKSIRYLIIIFFIAFLTFEPGFTMAPNDYAYFLGPINEIANGKTIYTQIPSLYGFMSVIFFVPFAKLGFSIIYLPFFVWTFFILEYFICFYLIYKFSKSLIFSIIGLFSILTINFYSLSMSSLIPAGNAFRWPPLIVAILLLYFFNITSIFFVFLLALLVFWTPDSGIALILGFMLTLLIFLMKKTISLKEGFLALSSFFLSIVSTFLIINFFHLIFGYKQIEFLLIFKKIREHGLVGLNMVPIEFNNFFWTVVIIYFTSIIYYFKRKKIDSTDNIIVFVANLSLFASIYYVSRSVPTNFFLISIFPTLNLFLLINIFLKRLKLKKIKVVLGLIFFLFVLIPAYLRSDTISNFIERKINRFVEGNIFRSDLDLYLRKAYEPEINLINRNIKQEETIINSIDDAYFFYLTRKKNMLNANPIGIIYGKKDIELAVKDMKKCPKKIIISCQIYKNDCKENLVYFHWEKDIYKNLLKEIEEKCNKKFIVNNCTERLCIAVAD